LYEVFVELRPCIPELAHLTLYGQFKKLDEARKRAQELAKRL
jgi:hypothetical protein